MGIYLKTVKNVERFQQLSTQNILDINYNLNKNVNNFRYNSVFISWISELNDVKYHTLNFKYK